MKFETAVAVLLLSSILGVSWSFANAQPFIPPPMAANQTKQAHLFGMTTTFNVNVVCANGQLAHQSKTVQSGQPAATINVNCGGGGSGTGTGTQGPPGPPGPPATICIVTPENSCATAANGTAPTTPAITK